MATLVIVAGNRFLKYIADKYGREKVGELLINIRDAGRFEEGLKNTLGLTLEELKRQMEKRH